MWNRRSSSNIPTLFALVLLLDYGCSSGVSLPLSGVSGTVTRGGKPLDGGQISFMSREGFGTSAAIGSQGEYTLASQYGSAIPSGIYHVVIIPAALANVKTGDHSPPIRQEKDPANEARVPRKYWDFATSGLQFAVEPGRQKIDIKLDD